MHAELSRADDAHLIERLINRQTLLRGGFLHVSRDTVRLPDGTEATRELIHHPGAVMVVPLVDDLPGPPLLLLERQYRHPLRRVMIEFPAGKLEAGEDHGACAVRELAEETGYTADLWAYAGCLNTAIAYCDEVIHIWFAKDLHAGPPQRDVGEFLDVITLPTSAFFAACRSGQITDSKSLVAALWLQQVLSGQWDLTWRTGPPSAAMLAAGQAVQPALPSSGSAP